MSLTKTTVVDQITVVENGIVLYREATRIIEDGQQLFSSCSFTLDPYASLQTQMTTK